MRISAPDSSGSQVVAASAAARRSHERAATTNVLATALRYLALIVLAIIALGPFYWLTITAFKSESQPVFSFPPELIPNPPSLSAYVDVFNVGQFYRYVINSAIVAIAVVAAQCIFCSMGAYPLARMRFPGRDVIFFAILATLIIPFEVTLIPAFVLVAEFGFVNHYTALIIPAAVSPFGIFLMRQAFLTIPLELEEAARIDGAREFRIYAQIMLPLAAPSLATLAIFTFVGQWNSLLWPVIVLKTQDMYTLPIAIAFLDSTFYGGWRQLAAGSVISVIPVLIVFLSAQRFFLRGLVTGALKG